MKKILALAAAAALTCGVSAYAANPFSDVSTDDWAYQAVSDLSAQGVVEGYPDGTFRGERNMTRYELAQIIARLMAREDQLNAEQRATLDKLAGEYAGELANLGVRVSNLEKKVGSFSFSGNARMRFRQTYDKKNDGNSFDNWDGRMKIIAHADVNDSTYVQGRLRSDFNFKDNGDANTYMEQLVVHHRFGDKVDLAIGREDVYLGQTGLYYDDEFDGAILKVGSDGLTAELGYGRFYSWDFEPQDSTEPEAFYAHVYGNSGRFSYEANYIDVSKDHGQVWGAGLTAGITDDIDLFGDYFQNVDYEGDPKIWTAGVGFGHVNLAKPGSFRLTGQYVKAEKGAFFGVSTYDITPHDLTVAGTDGTSKATEVDYWLINADVTLMKNVRLHGEYGFDVDAKGTNVDYDDMFAVSLNYVF